MLGGKRGEATGLKQVLRYGIQVSHSLTRCAPVPFQDLFLSVSSFERILFHFISKEFLLHQLQFISSTFLMFKSWD